MVVLGATGDLAGRLLLPAVAGLRADGTLGADFRLLGAGPQPWSDADFAAHVRRRLTVHAPGLDPDGLVAALRYRPADIADPAQVAAVVDAARRGSAPVVVYLALPTGLMLGAVRALQACGLPPGSRIAVEKPFGEDLAGAVTLNAALAGDVGAYRVDHLLAMTAVQELPGPFRDVTGDVELLFEETLALEGRAGFYDRAGALRDVLQNHLVQLLCLVAARPDGTDPARRAAVLRAVPPPTAADSRRARYTAGRLADGRAVPDYTEEDGVDASRDTETFAEVALQVGATRVVLRTGKALARRRRGVLAGSRWLDLDAPELGRPGGAEARAYERIVADLLSGGTRYAVGAEETELAWRLLTPVLRDWAAGAVALETYPAGSAGPH